MRTHLRSTLARLGDGRPSRRRPGRGRHRGGPRGFPGFGPPRGPRARRGDVRAAILLLLAEEPRNGYQLMQEIERRSDGLWRPSPGSVYPALQQLEDEGLVAPDRGGPQGLHAHRRGPRPRRGAARRARRAVGRRQGRRRRGRRRPHGGHAPARHGALPAHPLGHRGPAPRGAGGPQRDPAQALPDPRGRGPGRPRTR